MYKSNNHRKDSIQDYIDKIDYKSASKQQNPTVYQTFRNLINDGFVNKLREDVEIMIRNLSQSSQSSQPRKRTRATTCVPPPKRILPTPALSSTPAQKRSVEHIDGIDEKKETQSPGTKRQQRHPRL